MQEEEEKARNGPVHQSVRRPMLVGRVLRVSHTNLRAAAISVPPMSACIESTWAVAMSRFS